MIYLWLGLTIVAVGFTVGHFLLVFRELTKFIGQVIRTDTDARADLQSAYLCMVGSMATTLFFLLFLMAL